ncbi:hypothetical protein ABG768_021727 [Culter alburnus]|uniref:Uncharacterized protein n=1 Tax=Culter alburnus TaxID=194366 RepID=A0AAW2AUW9_CULAL
MRLSVDIRLFASVYSCDQCAILNAKCTIPCQRLIVNLHFSFQCTISISICVQICLSDLCMVSDHKILLGCKILDQRTITDQKMYSNKFRTLRPLTCVSPDLTAPPLTAAGWPKLQPRPPPKRSPKGIATMTELTRQNSISVSSRPQSVQLPPIFGTSYVRGLCPNPPAQEKTTPSVQSHQSFDKASLQRNLAEKVSEQHIEHQVAKGRRYNFMEARRTEVRRCHEREKVEMEEALTLQRAKLEQEVHQVRQKHAQFLEEKRRRIKEQEMVCRFNQHINSRARAVHRHNDWKQGKQQ